MDVIKTDIGYVESMDFTYDNPFRNQPLTGMYLLSILEEKYGDSHSYSLIDFRGYKKNNFMYHIPKKDIYLYSVTSPSLEANMILHKEIKNRLPGSVHVAGGCHTSLYPDTIGDMFDSVVVGEGDNLITNIIDDISNGVLKKYYKDYLSIDINDYPFPSRKYLPYGSIVETGMLDHPYRELPGTSVMFSRGCPFRCHFCANMFVKKIQYRKACLIKKEIKYLKEMYGVEALALKDDNCIPFNKEYAYSFLKVMKDSKMKWRGQTRGNGVDKDIMKLAWKSGCVNIAIGIESISQKVLNLINKKMDIGKAKEYICFLKNIGIGVRLHFIIGLPGETDTVAKDIISFIKEMQPSSVLLSLLIPMPGSYIYNHRDEFGIELVHKDFTKYFGLFGRHKPEKGKLVFRYNGESDNGRSNEDILRDHDMVQTFIREEGYNF